MKLFLLLFLFCSCNKIIYRNPNNEGYYEQRSLLWKRNGQYRGISVIYNNQKDHWFYITVQKSTCDSFFFSEHFKTSDKKENINNYFISRAGDKRINFSTMQLQMPANAKKIADSLGWCQSGILSIPDSLFLRKFQRKKKTS
jgi:hypothetical protein